jgi:pimeloyl-ACP methyl ester carboxylesterase
MQPSSHYMQCAGREIHYLDWGAGHPRTVIAWHGLARTGRDMDELAAYLSAPERGYRVICGQRRRAASRARSSVFSTLP